jgi:hypothetical protein
VTSDRRDALLLAGLTLALLLPFADKAVHVDDSYFVRSAEHILEHPLDFYGFDVFGLGRHESMSRANMNPPGAAYYLAAIGALFGFGERALHLGMLVPALALVLGTLRLARALRVQPLPAGLILLSFPGFLGSATTLMVDVPASALWCWAVVFWIEALERGSIGRFAVAGLLAGACVLTKYVGIGLVPLFVAHAVIVGKPPGRWWIAPALTTAIALAFRAAMLQLYDLDPFLFGATYSLDHHPRTVDTILRGFVVGLSFLGGSCVTVAFFAPRVWASSVLVPGAILGISVAAASALTLTTHAESRAEVLWIVLHFAAFVLAGTGALALVAGRVFAERDASAWLLAGWVAGIFAFATVFNWTTNVRSFLPALPAVAVVLAGVLQRRASAAGSLLRHAPVAAGIGLSLVVAQGDVAFANAARRAALELGEAHRNGAPTVLYHGSWGFQYYLERLGVRPLDPEAAAQPAGTVVLRARLASWQIAIPPGTTEILAERNDELLAFAATHHPLRGAAWYGSFLGPIPYALGPVPALRYEVLRLVYAASLRPERR